MDVECTSWTARPPQKKETASFNSASKVFKKCFVK